ncbi:MAG TPA: hypothetical protein PK275_11925 [Chitinophagaceae bacterium]|jgi:hypothetical protein|nr:hypothetical protein [Chitinophagaceae bacterium]
MRKIIAPIVLFTSAILDVDAQKIIPIEYNGKKYEVLDMTVKGKITWGGYNEEVTADAAKSETNGSANTAAIVAFVGNNTGFEGKSYAAKLCKEAKTGGKEDWYLPSKDESDAIYASKDKFNVEERGTIWTSTEANATQAVSKYWYTGAFYNVQKVDTYHFVCIRKAE